MNGRLWAKRCSVDKNSMIWQIISWISPSLHTEDQSNTDIFYSYKISRSNVWNIGFREFHLLTCMQRESLLRDHHLCGLVGMFCICSILHISEHMSVCAPARTLVLSSGLLVESLISQEPASRLIRAGIQPPWLHLTISHQATYSIISCLNWRALLSLTQAHRKFPFIFHRKPAGCTQGERAQHKNAYTLWLQAEGLKLKHGQTSNPQQTKHGVVLLSVCVMVKKKNYESL